MYFFFFYSKIYLICFFFFFSSRRRHTRWPRDWSSDVCSSDLPNDRAHHTSLSVFPRPATDKSSDRPAGGPDKSSAVVLSKERRKRHVRPVDDPWRGSPSRWR